MMQYCFNVVTQEKQTRSIDCFVAQNVNHFVYYYCRAPRNDRWSN